MHKRGLCRRAVSVRLSVWISVIFVHSVETNKHVLKSFSLSGSHTIHVFPYQTLWQYSDQDRPNGGVKCRWGRQKSRFSTNIWLWHRWLVNCDQQFRPWSNLSRLSRSPPRISESCLWHASTSIRRREQNRI